MSSFYTGYQFLLHRLMAKRWNAFHSPFLFSLITFCCEDRGKRQAYDQIEDYRSRLLAGNTRVVKTDFGAGSAYGGNTKDMLLSKIVRRESSLPFQGRFMARLASFLGAKSVLEFGTSLGLTTAYLKYGAPEAEIISVEGDPTIAILATETFQQLQLKNIKVISSTFERFLEQSYSGSQPVDFLFLDGNHRSSAILLYAEKLFPLLGEHSVVVVDDIYWSADMQDGWKALCGLPQVTQSVDCFHFGLLFFRKEFLEKENHRINLPWWAVL